MTPPPPVFDPNNPQPIFDPMNPQSLEDLLAGFDFSQFQLPPEQMGGIGSFIDQALQQHQQQVQDAQQAAFKAKGFMTTPLPKKPNRYEDDFGTHDRFRDYE